MIVRAGKRVVMGVVLTGVVSVAGLAAQGSPAAPATPAGNVEAGKAVFKAKACYECHGYEGQGAATLGGPRIAPDPIPYRRFIAYLRAPTGEMPPYSVKAMPDQEVADIYAYLQVRAVPPPVRDIPILAK